MLKKSIAVVFAIALAMTATVASAQLCNIAAYADAGGTTSLVTPSEADGFLVDVFVVMFVEDTAAAAAYSITVPPGMFLQARYSGPSEDILFIDDPGGTNVALGECVVGYGGYPVNVARYVFAVPPSFAGGNIEIGANTTQLFDGVPSTTPLYVTCVDVTKECQAGANLFIEPPIPTESSSFSSIKSLYN